MNYNDVYFLEFPSDGVFKLLMDDKIIDTTSISYATVNCDGMRILFLKSQKWKLEQINSDLGVLCWDDTSNHW
ncbi:hypothetical protein [Bacillus salipaludis]|uniref:DUF2442 domain-containing protein n=1 Tax=Bacillus salipaludis TaxID=2547811 RepID=A0ABW8RSH1_9BACI